MMRTWCSTQGGGLKKDRNGLGKWESEHLGENVLSLALVSQVARAPTSLERKRTCVYVSGVVSPRSMGYFTGGKIF